ncbi:MAG TPA: V-type ATP synthase subunit A [Gemmatimonadota bacterium]
MSEARIVRVVGALVEAAPLGESALYELVHVGSRRLLGEVIRLDGERATIQVFEETGGIALEEPVERTGETLAAELGPGLLGSIYDGIGRPLTEMAARSGPFLAPGGAGRTLDPAVRWAFEAAMRPGDTVAGGDVIGWVEERPGLRHSILVPPGVAGRIESLATGSFTVDEAIGALEGGAPLWLAHRWPVRRPRPIAGRLAGDRPLLTGQRVLDFLFPVAEGGSVAVPGGFGTGKTVIEQSLAKFAEADVVVYVGCGERGNEMADMLAEFVRLTDPRTGRPVLDRTTLVVNTSNMPVVAREASVFFGVTVAEYYRDMGYRVALMADSLSRWAEALREIAARLREMPGEEGYPTRLADRLGKVYERAGRVRASGSPVREGSLTLVSAVSPPGGDFSEPVTQASLRVAGSLWALDPALANQRQFPAVDWETSYSLYAERTNAWFAREVGEEWPELRRRVLGLLQRDAELREISALVGPEALEDRDRLALDVARLAREVVLGQNAFDPVDAFCPPAKTLRLAGLTLAVLDAAGAALDAGLALDRIDLEGARRAIRLVRDAPPEDGARASEAWKAIEALRTTGAAELGR